MSTLKSINWALAWRRLVWTSFFAAFLGIVVYMAKDMARTQPVVFGLILLAAVVCAVAFVYARTNKEALLIATLALGVHAVLELSYWSSVVDDINTQALREQSAAASRDVVNERRRARYAASASGKGAGQLTAEVEAKKQDARWASSKQCTEATASASRSFCQEYFTLVADLAAAKEAANLETTVFHTTVETVDLPRNIAKGAAWIADVTGITVQTATNIIAGLMVLFIQAGLAFSLRIGWEPEKPRTAAQSSPAVIAPATASSPVLRDPPAIPARPERKAYVPTVTLPEFKPVEPKLDTPPAPEPDGDGTPVEAPEEPQTQEAAEDSRKVVSLFRDTGQLPEAARSKRKAHKPEGKVESWLGESTSQVDDPSIKVGSEACWKSYLAYCDATGKQPIGRKLFSRKLNVLLGQKTGKGRKRDKNGSVFTGLMINPVMATARRRVA